MSFLSYSYSYYWIFKSVFISLFFESYIDIDVWQDCCYNSIVLFIYEFILSSI